MDSVNWIRLCGWAGLLASLLVGTGEFLLQFTPNGGIEDMTSYLFFNDISSVRLTWGHYIAVLSAPLYVLGYYFLSKQLQPAGRKQSKVFFIILRVAMLIVSGLWIKLILSGRTAFPKWLAIFSPIVLLASFAGLYFAKTTLGLYLFPIAMNATHFIIFSLALFTTRKSGEVSSNG